MADITMCKGDSCPLKDNCYRYLANASEYQYYFVEAPYKDKDCEYYWKIDKPKDLKNI